MSCPDRPSSVPRRFSAGDPQTLPAPVLCPCSVLVGGRAHPFTVRVLLRVRFAVGSDDAWSATTRDVAAPCQTWRRTFAHAHLTRCHACRCPGLDTKPCLVPVCRALGHHVCVQGVPDCTEAKGALPCDFCESLKFLSPCVLCCAFPAHKELSVVVHAPASK